MAQSIPPIYFYLPQVYWPQDFPAHVDENWAGFGLGMYAWTIQTYLRLTADGFACELVNTLPSEGIVLVHRNALRAHRIPPKPSPRLMLICLKAELPRYRYAQLQIVQNPADQSLFAKSYYLPHWPQPGLIPRETDRGSRFETIAFFGHQNSLAPELRSPQWLEQLQDLGLTWQPIINTHPWDSYQQINTHWNNYSQIDAIVAVRSFDAKQIRCSRYYGAKPATKLYNAWLAGVPAILGPESAYRAERQCELDYLEVSSIEALLGTLKRLKQDFKLRQQMIQQGWQRAQAIQPANITAQWRTFLEEVAIPAYWHWCKLPRWQQQYHLLWHNSTYYGERIYEKGRCFWLQRESI
jgi:hypothetical protein